MHFVHSTMNSIGDDWDSELFCVHFVHSTMNSIGDDILSSFWAKGASDEFSRCNFAAPKIVFLPHLEKMWQTLWPQYCRMSQDCGWGYSREWSL